MVVGLGLDLIEVGRIGRAMERHAGFVERILTPAERETCRTPGQVAGRWAAKEAVAKAVGVHLTWQEVEILNDPLGAPFVRVSSSSFDPSRFRLLVSITHTHGQAAAVAVLERIVMQSPGV